MSALSLLDEFRFELRVFVPGAMLSGLVGLVQDPLLGYQRSLEWSDEIAWDLDGDPQDWIGFNVDEGSEELGINIEMEGATGAWLFNYNPCARDARDPTLAWSPKRCIVELLLSLLHMGKRHATYQGWFKTLDHPSLLLACVRLER